MRMRAHTQARNLPSPEALSPNIEEGVVNRRPLQALFLLPQGGARPATGPGAISIKPTDYARGLVFSEISRLSAVAIGRPIGRGLTTKQIQDHTVIRPSFSPLR